MKKKRRLYVKPAVSCHQLQIQQVMGDFASRSDYEGGDGGMDQSDFSGRPGYTGGSGWDQSDFSGRPGYTGGSGMDQSDFSGRSGYTGGSGWDQD